MKDKDKQNFFSIKGKLKGKDDLLPKEFSERTVTKAVKKNIEEHRPIFNKVYMKDGVPLFSQLELNINELCNRRCPFCPRSGDYPNQNLHIDLDLVESIALQLEELEFKGVVNICGTGEPLLTKYIESIVNKLASRKLLVEIVTNGDFLTIEKIKSLYSAGLSKFVVSMYDGAHQIKINNDIFKSAGIAKDRYILRDRWYTEEKDYGVIYTNRTGAIDSPELVKNSAPCYYPSYALYIDWNGDVLLCCQDSYNRTIKIGNANDRKIFDLWTDQEFIKYRKNLRSGLRCDKPCSQCNANGQVYGKDHAGLW